MRLVAVIFVIAMSIALLEAQQCNSNQFTVKNSNGDEYLTINSATEVKTCGGINICSEITNAKQSLSVGNNGELAISNGNSVQLPDPSATNEIQSLSITGGTIALSNNGGSVQLPDSSATNEIQTMSINGGTISLSAGGGSVEIPDDSTTNELQTLSINERSISLSNNGGSVTLPDFYRGFSVLTNETVIKANWVNVIFERVEFSSWPSAYNNVTGAFTVPRAGAYEFSLNGWWHTGTTGSDIRYVLYYKVNGMASSRYGGGQLSAVSTIMSTFSEVKILNVGDVVQVAVYTTIDVTVAQYWWQATYLGPLETDA